MFGKDNAMYSKTNSKGEFLVFQGFKTKKLYKAPCLKHILSMSIIYVYVIQQIENGSNIIHYL